MLERERERAEWRVISDKDHQCQSCSIIFVKKKLKEERQEENDKEESMSENKI